MRPRAKSRKHAGIHLSQSCARSRDRGFGCTNIGAIARKIPIDPTPSIPGRTGSSRECWRKNDIVYEKAGATHPLQNLLCGREQI
jgi:hypothetical protein